LSRRAAIAEFQASFVLELSQAQSRPRRAP
jgi:hypothetical protein